MVWEYAGRTPKNFLKIFDFPLYKSRSLCYYMSVIRINIINEGRPSMERAIRYSKKRADMLSLIQSTDCHPSAEWVYHQLKPTHPDLSLGTVYRNLIFFQDHGLIQSVGVVQGQERFDGVTTPHSHFVCECCGSVIDLPRVSLDSDLDQSVSRQYGLAVSRHELTFHGLCSACTQNNSSEPVLN